MNKLMFARSLLLFCLCLVLSVAPAAGQSNGLPPNFVISSIAWSPDGTRIVSGHFGGFVRVMDSANNELVYEVPSGSQQVTAVAWSPDGNRFSSANYIGTVQARDVADGQLIQEYNDGAYPVTGMVWGEDSRFVFATSSLLGNLRVWGLNSGILLESHPNAGTGTMSWNSTYTRILTGHSAGALIWNAESNEVEMAMQLPDEIIDMTNIATISATWHPSERIIATGHRRGQVRVWDVQTGELLYELQGNEYSLAEELPRRDSVIRSVHFSPDGQLLSAVSRGGAIRTWNIETRRVVDEFTTEYRISATAWSADGCNLAYGRNVTATPEDGRLYDLIDFCGEDGVYSRSSE